MDELKTGDEIISKLISKIEEITLRERLFREDFEQRIAAEMRGYIDDRLRHYFLRSPVTSDDRSKVMIHTVDGHRLLLDMRESFMAYHLIEHGEWERPVRDVIRRMLPLGGTYLDVGANIGVHCLLAAQMVGHSGHVIAVEPHPVTGEILRENIEINGLNEVVMIVNAAATETAGQKVSFEYFPQHPAMSGFRISKERIALFKATPETIEVPTTTVDALLEPFNYQVDLIKIDVEGFELNVLKGAVGVLAKNPDVAVLIEYEYNTVISLLGDSAPSDLWNIITETGLIAFNIHQKNDRDSLDRDAFLIAQGDLLLVRPGSKSHAIWISSGTS